MAFVVNDKIELIAGDEAVIRFVGKTKLNSTVWYGIEYLSSKSASKPTLITIDDIKTSNNLISNKKKQINSNKPTTNKLNKSIAKSPQKMKSIKKTTSIITTNNTNNKQKSVRSDRKMIKSKTPLKSPQKKRSNIPPKKSNRLSLQQKVNTSIALKSAKNKEKKQRSSSAPSSQIKPYLPSMTDINNTLAMSTDFDNISSTIDSPDSPKNKKKKSKNKHKNKIHKRHTEHMSDVTKGILSSPSLSAKTNKKIPTLSIDCSANTNSIGINFENEETQNMPSKNTKIGTSKSDESVKVDENTKSKSKWDYDYELAPIVLKSQTSSTNIDIAVLNEENGENNNVLTEEKEIEDDVEYKEQYAKIFSSIKITPNKLKPPSLIEIRRKSAPNVDCDIKKKNIDTDKPKKKKARKRGQSSAVVVSPPLTPRKKEETTENSKTSNSTTKKSNTGSLKKLKLNRTQSNNAKSKKNNKKRSDRNGITHGMYSHVQDITFNGKIVIGNRYLLKDDRYGICRYYGVVDGYKKGKYIGMELEVGEGDNNGCLEGKTYFNCSIKRDIDNDKRALFVTKTELKQDLGKA